MIQEVEALFLDLWQVGAFSLQWTHYFPALGSMSSSSAVSVLSFVILASVVPDRGGKTVVCRDREDAGSSQHASPQTRKDQLVMRERSKHGALRGGVQLIKPDAF